MAFVESSFGIHIIWAGRNNYTDAATVEADIAAMVALAPGRTMILSIINGYGGTEDAGTDLYNDIMGINSYLSSTYGSQYCDVRTPLVQPGDSTDVPRAAYRYDNIHLNDAGYALVAHTVYTKGQALGWW